jgi:hypothetical protein
MKKNTLLFILIIANFQILFAQIPHLTGDVKISILNGTIESDLEYSNVPKLKNYSIWLNAGLNIRYFRNAEDNFNYGFEKEYHDDKSSEAFQYYFPNNKNTGKFLPNTFKINYTGKFPVISDTLKAGNRGDWKGNIAFNGKSIRATEQSAWYPILYDFENDITINEITYDITVSCADCNSIYLNGASPVSGNTAHFKSDKPISMMLFAGLFDFNKNKNTNFINTGLNPEQEKTLGNWTDKIVHFYETKLKIPYGNPVTYLYTTPISKKNAWMFVTYPTVVIIGQEKYNVKSYFDPTTNALKKNSTIEYLAHELGHYYFGTVIVPNSESRWFFLEGLTEYLALQTSKDILGEESYQKKLDAYLKGIKDYAPKPLATIKNDQIDETYRYLYAPLLVTALEKEVGKEKVWNWLITVLNSEKLVKTDYEFFKKSLIKSGITENEFKKFEDTYILSENAKENLIKLIQKP